MYGGLRVKPWFPLADAPPAFQRGALLAAIGAAAAVLLATLSILVDLGEARDIRASVQAREAAALAARLDQAFRETDGAASAAAVALNASGAGGAALAVRAATLSDAVAGAAVVERDGTVLARSPGLDNALIRAALTKARETKGPGWAGAVQTAWGRTAPAVTRWAGAGLVIVAFVDPGSVLPEAAGDRRLMAADAEGRIIAARPGLEDATNTSAFALFGLATPRDAGPGAAEGPDQAGTRYVVGYARAETAGLWAVAARPVASTPGVPITSLIIPIALAGSAICAVVLGLLAAVPLVRRLRALDRQVSDTTHRLQITAEAAGDGIFEWDAGTDRVLIGDGLAARLGGRAGVVPLDGFLALFAPGDADRLKTALSQAATSGATQLDVTTRRPAHAPMVMTVRGRAVRSARGVRVFGVARDITADRGAERALVDAERRMRDAIEAFDGPFALFDPAGQLQIWNGAFGRVFGLDAAALHRSARYREVAAAVRRTVQGQAPDPAGPQASELELSDERWVRLVERRTDDGGLVMVGVEITALKLHEQALVASQRRLESLVAELGRSEREAREYARKYEIAMERAEAASRAKSAFLANMSHELRTPLNAINGFSEMMANEMFGPLGDKRYVAYARDVLTSGRHLLDLINDILDTAKIESGKFEVMPRPMDPEEAVEIAVRIVKRRAEEKQIALEVAAHDLPEIEADFRAVKQMLINLLGNAIKFTDPGGKVAIRAALDGDMMRFEVTDTGCGIPEEALGRLGRPFEQAQSDHARNAEGTGLGLALTRSFAEIHGGSFAIASKLGEGTTVTIQLPVKSRVAGPGPQGGAAAAIAA
jgi:two-component system cell cycle sensor histidine kinase PleC